jgi:hypothetical protein
LRDLSIQASLDKRSPAFHKAVRIEGDVQVIFQDNHIIGARGIEVFSAGEGAQLSLLHNEIESSDIGIYFFGDATGYWGGTFPAQLYMRENILRVKEGDDFSTGLVFRYVAGSSALLIRDEIEGGIGIDQGGQVSIIEGDIHGAGIWLRGGQLSVWNTAIRESKHNGISVVPYEWGFSGLELQHSEIINNQGYGIALDISECDDTSLFSMKDPYISDYLYIKGRENRISGNEMGDLCPENYPWPIDFIAWEKE